MYLRRGDTCHVGTLIEVSPWQFQSVFTKEDVSNIPTGQPMSYNIVYLSTITVYIKQLFVYDNGYNSIWYCLWYTLLKIRPTFGVIGNKMLRWQTIIIGDMTPQTLHWEKIIKDFETNSHFTYFLKTLQVRAPCHGGVLYSFWYWWNVVWIFYEFFKYWKQNQIF